MPLAGLARIATLRALVIHTPAAASLDAPFRSQLAQLAEAMPIVELRQP